MSMKKLVTLLATAMVAGLVHAAQFPEISIADVKSAISTNSAVLLDVNGTDSWLEGHVPGAIDFVANKDKLAALLPQDKNALVVAYCGNPHCTAYLKAATAAQALGYTNVKHMTAGIAGWKDAGETVEKGTK